MSDTITINLSTEDINLVVTKADFAFWGTIFGSLTAQTDLWNTLSAKALNADLIDLSGNVIDFEAFISSVSGSWNGGQEALTVLAGNSALWDFGYDVATYVQANSAFWEESSEIIPTVTNYLSTVPVTLSSADVRGKLLSAGTDLFDIFLTSETDSQTLSYIPSSYLLSISNGNTVNLSSINSLFGSVSGKYEDVYSSVVNTSGNWDSAYASTTALDLSAGLWNEAYNVSTVYQSTSSSFATNTALNAASSVLTPLTLTNSLTSQLVLNTDFNSYKTNVASATATLLPTSIYQGASGFWQSASTNVQSNSANWNTAFNRSTVFSNVSSRYDSSSTAVESNSANWNNAYIITTAYSSVSSSFATNTNLNAVSSLLTPLTLTNTLTSQLVLNTDFNSYKTNVASATATLLPTSIYQQASGTWQNASTNVQSNSANWNTAFDRSTVFSSVSSRYDSSSTVVESNSANWNNAYNTGTVYQANSSSYATYNFVNSNFLNLTGGTIEGNLTLSGNFYIAGSAATINAVDLVITDPLIYLAEGNPSDILDIGFTGSYNYNSDPHEHTGLVRSHNTKKWTLFSGLTAEVLSALTIDFNDPSLQIDTLKANLEGNVIGGTVQGSTLSSTGIVYSQGGNSDLWNTAFDRSTVFSSVSSRYDSASTVVESNSANWILDGGNTKNSNITIGTNDTYSLNIETSGTTRMSIASSGGVNFYYNDIINGFISINVLETPGADNGSILTGSLYFLSESDRSTGTITGIGTKFLEEVRVGDRLTNVTTTFIGIGNQAGFFYVKSISSDTSMVVSRPGHSSNIGPAGAFSVRRYKSLISISEPTSTSSVSAKFFISNDGAFYGGGFPNLGTITPNSFNWGGVGNFFSGPNTGGIQGYAWRSTGGWVAANTSHGSPALYVGDPSLNNGVAGNLFTYGINYLNGSTMLGSTSQPNEKLTVVGNVSATGIVYSQDGNSDLWNTAFDKSTVFSSVSSRYDSSSTVVESNSANWNFGYDAGTFVQANSANWEESAEILPTVTNYLSTSNVLMSAVNVTTDIVANRIQATVKNFYIDHPTKPGKHLVYSSLETPYNGIQLTGEAELKNSKCVVELPDYIRNLIDSDNVHIQLTNHKHSKVLYVDSIEIDQNRFTVKCDAWTSKFSILKFFWLLNGVRKDIPKLETEV